MKEKETEVKYYSFNEFDGEKGWVCTMSEQEIKDYYWSYWTSQMTKVGREDRISEENMLRDFVDVHWAWESDENGNPIGEIE